jgi:hypothetical protein
MRFIPIAILLAITPAGSFAYAAELCGVTYETWNDLFRQIQSNPKLTPVHANPGFKAFSEKGRELARIWAVTEPENFAHPSAACRSVVLIEGAPRVKTLLKCFSTKENCERLLEGYKRLDKQMVEEWENSRRQPNN